jgi:hypothetical protein
MVNTRLKAKAFAGPAATYTPHRDWVSGSEA